MTLSRWTRVFRAVGAAVVPAVVLLCCANSAAAGCGDYVTILGPDGKLQMPAGHGNEPTKAPCHGPNCSGAPKAPAPIPPAPTSPAPVVKALVPLADGQPGDPGRGRLPPPPDGSPVRLTSFIFHPPRA
jgi:hypothetical protein